MAVTVAPGTAGTAGTASAARTALRLTLFAFLVYALTGGGRIVGSDEVTMLELSRAMLAGGIAVPAGATAEGRHGRSYSKNAAGQAVLALPLVAASEALAGLTRLDPPRRVLAVRFGSSFFNAAVAALVLGVFYAGARALGAGAPAALAAALMLGFATPLWVYAKSFMAEPLESLGLLAALLGASLAAPGAPREGRPGPARGAELLAAAGAFLAVSVKLSMLPLAAACLLPMLGGPPARWRWPAAGVALALAGHGLYDVARFGTPWETGYGAQATPAAYSTPLLVGLYGLLLSSGKGVAWFAPPLWLAPAGLGALVGPRMAAGGSASGARALPARLGLASPRGRAAWGGALAWAAGLLLYARFQHWAGDGSFGPRYLVPLLPLALLPVAFALESASAARRAAALALSLIGIVVQIGGVAIYFGAQMREAGDYPYRLPLEDRRFMSDSHFNPAFSPIAGHWRMLVRNAGAALRGEAPRLGVGGERDPRLGVGAADQRELLRGLDFWWLYLVYAGLPRAPVWGAAVAVALLAAWAGWRTAAAFRAEAGSP